MEYPKWWDTEQMESVPYGQSKLIELDLQNSEMARMAKAAFKTANVVKIECVMNQRRYDKWWHEKQAMVRLLGSEGVHQRALYHGTRNEEVLQHVLLEGFRKEFSRNPSIGQGTYFSRDPNHSVIFCPENSDGIKKILRCDVLCGESTLGGFGHTLTAWPRKPVSKLMYDSLVDPGDPTEFVVHSDERCYPMLVIHFN